MKSAVGWAVAAASGAALWAGANLVEGSREPWDVESYWVVQLPLAALLCAVLGFAFPERPWRWPLAVMLAQLPVMMLFTGEVAAPLMVVGLALLLIFALPGMLAAWLGAAVRRRIAGVRL